MATSNGEFVDVVSPSAISDLLELNKLLGKTVTEVNRVNTASKNLKVPSDFKSSINDLNTILKQSNAILRQQVQLQQQLAAATNQSTTATNNNTRAELDANKAEQQRLRTERDRLSLSEAQRRASEAQERAEQRQRASAERLGSAYLQLSRQQAEAARRVQDLISRGRTAEQTQQQYNRELRNAQREFTALNQRVLMADRAVGRFNRNVGNYPTQAIRGLKDLVGAFGIIGGVTAFAMITKDIFKTAKELQSLDLALKQVIGSSEDFKNTQSFLNDVAEDYGVGIKELTKSYTQFYVSAKDKLSGQQIQDIFRSISKAAGAMGLSVEQQEGAFLALTQMLSKGTVQAEELRGQLSERLPGAFGILAKSMGVTEVQLNKMLKDGKVLAAEVLPEFANQLERTYSIENLNRVESLTAETTRLGNAWTDFVRSVTEGEGPLSKAFIAIIKFAKEAVETLENLTKSEEQREDEIGKAIEEGAYKRQLELLKDISVAKRQIGQSDEEYRKAEKEAYDFAENAAKNDISLSHEYLKAERDKRKAINATIKTLEEQLKAEDNIAVLDHLSPTSFKIDKQNKLLQRSLDLTKNILSSAQASRDFLNQGKEVVNATPLGLTDAQIKEAERRADEELRNRYTLQKLILESEKRSFEERLENEQLYYAQREEAAQDIYFKEIELAELARKEGLRNAKGNQTLQLIVWEEYYKDLDSIVKNNEERVLKLRKDAYKEFVDYSEKFQGEGLRGQSTEDLVSLWDKKKEDDAEAAAKAKEQLKKDIDDYLKTFTEGFFQDAGLPTLFKVLNDEIAGFGEDWATTVNTIAEISQEAFNFINQNSQAYFDAQYARLEKEKELALRFAGESSEAQQKINEDYEARKREIQIKEAKAAKETALFNAGMNIAQGITAALAQGPSGIPLAVVIGALGAIQLAMISSRPIPEYWHGTDNHQGGLMKVNDAPGSNYREKVILPDGTSFVPEQRNALLNAPKGTKVLKAGSFNNDLNSMLSNNGILYPTELLKETPNINISNGGGLTESQMESVMNRSLKKVQVNNITLDNKGIRTYIGGESGRMENLNNYTHRKGLTL